jgi:hypothetical protein
MYITNGKRSITEISFRQELTPKKYYSPDIDVIFLEKKKLFGKFLLIAKKVFFRKDLSRIL